MKKSIRKALLICSCSPLLMSILCEKQDELRPLIYNKTKATVSLGPTFSVTDTIWISGAVSSMAYDEDIQDSIKNPNESVSDIISVLRLRPENRTSNSIEAIKDFEIVTRVGNIDFLGACPDSELIAEGQLTENGNSFKYEIGLISKDTGDFALSWLIPIDLQNRVLNTQILEKYPIRGNNSTLGMTKCGITYTIKDVKARRSTFFFTVE